MDTEQPALTTSCRVRCTPYSPRLEALGVRAYTVYNHMLLPTVFRSLEDDYAHLKRHVQLWDVSCQRQVALAGPDAARLLQLMTPRDLGRAEPGQCLFAPLAEAGGGLVNDPVVLKLAEDRFWVSIADSDVRLWALGIAQSLGLDVAVDEPPVHPLAVQGPKADAVVAGVFGEAARDIRFFRFRALPFRGRDVIVARSGWSKQGGFEMYPDDPELALLLWDALWEAGQRHELGPGCPNLIERIEGGLLSYGNDMTIDDTPYECGFGRLVHLDRPIEFLARDALARVAETGPPRLVRGVRVEGEPVPPCAERWTVRGPGGRPAGAVTSAAWSPDLRINVAIAMLDAGHWDAGMPVAVETPEGERPGTVSALPFG